MRILLLIQNDFDKHNFVFPNLMSIISNYLDVDEEETINELSAVCLEKIHTKDKSQKCDTCKHYFHRRCLEEWKKIRHTCPYCNS